MRAFDQVPAEAFQVPKTVTFKSQFNPALPEDFLIQVIASQCEIG
jgi:hypothetical protein